MNDLCSYLIEQHRAQLRNPYRPPTDRSAGLIRALLRRLIAWLKKKCRKHNSTPPSREWDAELFKLGEDD
jgi:hypothetical protein